MKSLTLHGLDDQLSSQIKRRAKELSISMNELAKRLLAQGLGIMSPAIQPHRDAFTEFCGSWTENEEQAFNARISDTEKVDPEDWK